jgi:hypothetical protein
MKWVFNAAPMAGNDSNPGLKPRAIVISPFQGLCFSVILYDMEFAGFIERYTDPCDPLGGKGVKRFRIL